MSNQIFTRFANSSDAEIVGKYVAALIAELFPEEKEKYPLEEMLRASKKLLVEDSGVWAILAYDSSKNNLGVLTLNECAAISMRGNFGEIYELYVCPEARSMNVGRTLIKEAERFGRERGWSEIEVGAPDLPRWQRTYEFYKGYGFYEIGPRLALEL